MIPTTIGMRLAAIGIAGMDRALQAVTEQAVMSAAIARPGNDSIPVAAPINRNGMASAYTSKKNVRGDLLYEVSGVRGILVN